MTDFNKTKQTENSFNLIGKVKVKVLVILAALAGALIFTQLVFANNLATDGHKLSEVNGEIARLERENTTLKAKIAKESSLSALSQKAGEMGFGKPTKVIVP